MCVLCDIYALNFETTLENIGGAGTGEIWQLGSTDNTSSGKISENYTFVVKS